MVELQGGKKMKKNTKHGWHAGDFMKSTLRSSIFKNNIVYAI
jgi:hypothetical protein